MVQPAEDTVILCLRGTLKLVYRRIDFLRFEMCREDFIYYISIAVSKSTLWNEFATFTVTARTPADVTLIPCDSQIYPDGIKAVASIV